MVNVYSKMYWGIIVYSEFIIVENVEKLRGFDMVFLCIDVNEVKVFIVLVFEGFDVKFIDVGIGVNLV